MESKSFSESWQDYTIRDKILLGSSILPTFISFIYLLSYFPIISLILFTDDWLGLGQYLFEWNEAGDPNIFNVIDPETNIAYIMRPIWILLSTLSLATYGFFLFKTDEEVNNLLNQSGQNNGPSSLFRTSNLMMISAGSHALILFSFLLGWYVIDSDIFYGLNPWRWIIYEYEWFCEGSFIVSILTGVPAYGCLSDSGKEVINPMAYLYLPHLIATVALAYYTRIKNEEENTDFIETKPELVTTDKESTSGDQSPVTESHVFLVITIVGGMFGLDKAYKGEYLLAVLKFLTLGGLWIWQIYDIYVAAGEAGRSWALDSDSSLTTEKHVILITAIVGGHLGLDRAYKGDGVTGVFKLLTLGGLGIWWLVDVYVAAKEAGKSW